MKNFEKYIDKIFDPDVEYNCCEVCKLRLGYIPCDLDLLSHEDCKAEHEHNRKWLLEEYIERPKLTRNEKAILEIIDKKYKWIARDENGCLYLFYSIEPHKYDNYWTNDNKYDSFRMFNHLFKFIKWEDTEPRSIEELLKCEVVEDE